LWYLSGENNLVFIDYYLPDHYTKESDDKVTVRSAYGERLFNHRGVNQIQTVIELLKKKPTTRRAIIQLFDASDLECDYASIPCTCTLQFLVRDNKLNMFVSMRSNDAYIGLAHDVFAFTMIQELVARSIKMELGEYKHSAGSLHLYEKHAPLASIYVAEAWQSTIAMPKMPLGDPWPAIAEVRNIENAIRMSGVADVSNSSLDDYWKDLCWLLTAFRAYKAKDVSGLLALRANLTCDTFKVFIDAKADSILKENHAN
jgi:thymidylate synthase